MVVESFYNRGITTKLDKKYLGLLAIEQGILLQAFKSSKQIKNKLVY